MSNNQSELTILIPALNEEQFVEKTCEEAYFLAERLVDRFEIILVDDGSTDRTGSIMDFLEQKYPCVRAIHFHQNQGLTNIFRLGIQKASYEFMTILPGDYSFTSEGIQNLFEQVGIKQLVIGYRVNLHQIATLKRRFLSGILKYLMWPILGKLMKDIHGPYIYPVSLLRKLELKSTGYAFGIEVLAKIFSYKVSYVEVPVFCVEQSIGNSSAFSLKTIFNMAETYIPLLFRIGLRK